MGVDKINVERHPLAGKHSWFDGGWFGANREDLVANVDRCLRSASTIDMARMVKVNDMVEPADRTRHEAAVARFALQAESYCHGSNAVDVRIIQFKTRPDLSDIKVLSIDGQ